MKNNINKIICATLLAAGFSACASEFDNDFKVTDKPASVAQNEQLSAYKTLLEYAGSSFALGNTLTSAEFLNEGTPTSLTLTNFNQLTLSDAFLHSKLVNGLGEVDSTSAKSAIDLAVSKGISLYGGTLVSSTNLNESYLSNALPGKMVEATFTYDFENDALGTEYPFGFNGEARSDKGASVVEDPAGESGHCLHVACGLVFPVITFNLPKGTTLGDFVRVEMDWRAVNDGGLNGFAGVLHTYVKDSGYDYPTPGAMGCKLGEWGRGKVVLDLAAFNFDDAKKAWTSVPLEFGSVAWWQEYYVDNIKWVYTYNEPDYESAEAQQIAKNQMKTYVQTLVKSYGDNVSAWTIADRPISSPSTMFWKRVLGDTYFALAAKYAREQNASLKLFVSEEGLTDAARLADFLAVIKKAENEGAKIDGIEVLLDAKVVDQSLLTSMFNTLAKTGKFIRLSGLATIGNNNTVDADALTTVLSLYKQIIPESQRYGISFSNGTYTLWNTHFDRLPAFASVADNL